jgi:hypothetical protein
MCEKAGPQDRCLLYVFRCAVYYASTAAPEPELLKWWSWKDGAPTKRKGDKRTKRKRGTA